MSKSNSLKFIFVHGLSGWGSYDAAYKRMPYWGMWGGDLISFLREKGFDCYAASVAPMGSAWDRACELYAQITGSRVDYGEAHSKAFRHERFGRDFSDQPLIREWDPDTRLVLLGHSFGGTTVRLFLELMAHGDEKERQAAVKKKSPDLSGAVGLRPDSADTAGMSPLFAGGMEGHIHSLVTLSSPMNGTTAYDLFEDPSFDSRHVKTPWWSKILGKMMSLGTSPRMDGRDIADFADYDMHVDHALELNSRISTLENVYYFSVPCSAAQKQPDQSYKPKRGIEPLFVARSNQIGNYCGKTAGGMFIDESWRENDGLVNTLSSKAPLGAPAKELDKSRIEAGIWNVFPVLDGDHMWLQGGLMHKHDIRDFYLELLNMIMELK